MKRVIGLLLTALLLLSPLLTTATAEEMGVEQWEGKRIAIQSGTVFVDRVYDIIKDPQVSSYSGATNCLLALCSGKVDAMVMDEPVARYMAAQNSGVSYFVTDEKPDDFAIAVPKSEEGDAILLQLNAFIQERKEDGTVDALTAKWFEGSEAEQVLTVPGEELPDMNGTLTIATDATFPPFEFIKEGEPVGYEIDLMNLFCQAYGYHPEYVNVDFGGIISGVVTGKYDLGVSGFTVTEERKQSVNFSDPLYLSGVAVVYRNDTPSGEGFLDSFVNGFTKTFLTESRWKLFLSGIAVTMEITLLSILFGTALGFGAHLLCRRGNPVAVSLSRAARWLIKGLPAVLFLLILYYVIFGHSSISAIWVSVIGFSLMMACSVHGMLEAGERALDPGQTVAARALGYNESGIFFRILLPQALRHVLPTYRSEMVAHIKGTAVVGYIAAVDITKVADMIRGKTFDAFFPLIAAAAIYFILAGVLQGAVDLLQRRTDPHRRSEAQILKGVEKR